MAEVQLRMGVAAAVEMVKGSGAAFLDPTVVGAFVADAAAILDGPQPGDAWDVALRGAPTMTSAGGGRARRVAGGPGDFVDLKPPVHPGPFLRGGPARRGRRPRGRAEFRCRDGDPAGRSCARSRPDRHLQPDLVRRNPSGRRVRSECACTRT